MLKSEKVQKLGNHTEKLVKKVISFQKSNLVRSISSKMGCGLEEYVPKKNSRGNFPSNGVDPQRSTFLGKPKIHLSRVD